MTISACYIRYMLGIIATHLRANSARSKGDAMHDDDDEHLSPLNHAVVEMVKRRMREVSAEMEAEGTVSRRDAGPVLRDATAKTNPTAPAPSTGNEANAACPPAHRDAPARSPVHPDEKAQYAKRSQPAVPFHATELAHAGVCLLYTSPSPRDS